MKKGLLAITAAALLAASAMAAPAAVAPSVTIGVTPKVAMVDIATVLKDSPQVTQMKDNLQAKFKPRYQQIEAAQKNLGDMVDKIKKNGVTMQEDQRKQLQDQIAKAQQDLMAMQQSFQQDLNQARSKDMETLLGQLQATIKQVAQKNGDTLVLPKDGVAYADPSMDITAQVEQAFNSSHS